MENPEPGITRLEATVIALVSMGINPIPERRGNARLVRTTVEGLRKKCLIDEHTFHAGGSALVTAAGLSALRARFVWEMTCQK